MPAAAEQLPACFFFFIIITVGTSRSRDSPFAFSALAVPSLSSFAYRVADIIHLVISDIVIFVICANANFRIPSAYANSPSSWLFSRRTPVPSFFLSFVLHLPLSVFLYPKKKIATPIENRARGTFATTRGDRLAAPLIIHTRSLASDGGLLIQLTTQNPPGQPSFRHHPACGTGAPLLALRASRYPWIYFFARGNYFWCLFPRFVNIHPPIRSLLDPPLIRSSTISLSLSLSLVLVHPYTLP